MIEKGNGSGHSMLRHNRHQDRNIIRQWFFRTLYSCVTRVHVFLMS